MAAGLPQSPESRACPCSGILLPFASSLLPSPCFPFCELLPPQPEAQGSVTATSTPLSPSSAVCSITSLSLPSLPLPPLPGMVLEVSPASPVCISPDGGIPNLTEALKKPFSDVCIAAVLLSYRETFCFSSPALSLRRELCGLMLSVVRFPSFFFQIGPTELWFILQAVTL